MNTCTCFYPWEDRLSMPLLMHWSSIFPWKETSACGYEDLFTQEKSYFPRATPEGNMTISRCIFITTPFRLNRRNATSRNYVQTTCISNWLIWKEKVCKTFLSSSRNISIIIVTQNSLKRVSWPIFWTKSVTL